ncbi:MAG: hypothetical protein KGI60_01535 [Patescibacteria group bacterium]|nr:hypothetical protein [Patescibacteria group bacterium]
MPRRQNKGIHITSGDALVDFLFAQALRTLNQTVGDIFLNTAVFFVSRKKKKGGKKSIQTLCGLLTEDDDIHLSASKSLHPNRRAIAKTLLHEALHATFAEMEERHILQFEDRLWERLSPQQISLLCAYVPRRVGRKHYDR